MNSFSMFSFHLFISQTSAAWQSSQFHLLSNLIFAPIASPNSTNYFSLGHETRKLILEIPSNR
jgi:hypothetical protein